MKDAEAASATTALTGSVVSECVRAADCTVSLWGVWSSCKADKQVPHQSAFVSCAAFASVSLCLHISLSLLRVCVCCICFLLASDLMRIRRRAYLFLFVPAPSPSIPS